MSINWNNIRPIHNSLNDGFEELVCQLASKETIPGQKHFHRIGKPDAGKECYWEMNNGNLFMWQAKYFTTSLTTTQWSQIHKSVKNAIDKHPKLVKYYVSLPIDMPDAKVNKKTSMLDKWKKKVKEWQIYAATKRMFVEFEYWGSTGLISRLSKKENEGLTYFWFNKEEFTDDWLDYKNNESINALGARYTRDLNFELPIAKTFDGLSRDKNFANQIHKFYKDFLKEYRNIQIQIDDKGIKIDLTALNELINQIRKFYEPITFKGNDVMPLEDLSEKLKSCFDIVSRIINILYKLREAVEKDGIKEYYSRPYSNEISKLSSFQSNARKFQYFLNSATCQLANRPYLILTGKAGMGKSHLLADIVEKRRERGQHSLFLLGENFTSQELPWTQILYNHLRKKQIDELIFLGALNAKAEIEGNRIVVFIDAINEGNGRKVWPRKLKSFIQSFENYPWLGLVVSIRTSFINLIAPLNEIKADLAVRINHQGFSGFEYAAVKRFFNYFNIVQPTSPLLNPEFQNPLFLKLFCKSIADRGLHEIPSGYEGITTVIDYFLDSINFKLALPEELDYDEKKPLIRYAVHRLLEEMVNEGKDYVEYPKADAIVDNEFNGKCGNRQAYLKRLISEGVLNHDVLWKDKGEYVDVIYFAYQRFQDHLTVSLLLDKYLDISHPELCFQNGKLFDLIKDKYAIYSNQNLIEALSIQLPERIGQELFEVAPEIKLFHSVAEAFIQSLVWRKNETINENSQKYVTEVIAHNDNLVNQFMEVTISASMKPGFYFNAERLHASLLNLSLSKRDKIWTTWLQDKYDREETGYNAIKRLIDYAWNVDDKQEQIHDNSILLGCITLSWFLTSANRYLRDAATKALVCLLQNRTHLIIQLIEKFKGVNDPYVLERIYAAVYGAVLRTSQKNSLVKISEFIYQEIFCQKLVYPHILIRDYARGVIEYTISSNYQPKVDIIKIRPPYKSRNLPAKFPSIATIDKKYKPKGKSGNYGKKSWGSTAILSSMTTEYGRGTARYGDFGRYVFQRAFDDWNINYNGLSNYAIERIFKLGYKPQIFSEFDSEQGSGRGAGHKERIGKKYQWLVFYELLAKVSDQCKLIDESNWEKPKKFIPYDGPWYPYVRDIDPTTLIKETLAERYVDEHTAHWWFNKPYTSWHQNAKEWVTNKNDLPLPENILEVKDQNDTTWLWLEIHPEWGEPESLEEDKYTSQKKRLWYQMRSCFIRKENLTKLKKAFNRNFHRGELPEARSMYTIFDKEYYWSPAFNFFNKRYYHGGDWIEIFDGKTDGSITKIHRTAEYYNWEEEFDCSKTSAIQYYKPTEIIQKGLQLKFSHKEGQLIDNTGKTICFDPSVYEQSISGLLIRKEELVAWLKKENLMLIWNVVGEKQFSSSLDRKATHPTRLNFSGLYTLEETKIKGNLTFKTE